LHIPTGASVCYGYIPSFFSLEDLPTGVTLQKTNQYDSTKSLDVAVLKKKLESFLMRI
jgi:hypothetical protein